jgi:Fic family protein
MITGFGRQVLDGLPLDKGVVPGEFRTHNVTVGGVYRGVPHYQCGRLMQHLSDWLNGPDFRPDDRQREEMRFIAAVLKAILAHLYIAWIHPFGDGNGRTARLVEFQVLVAVGLPTPTARLMSNHYNQTRAERLGELYEARGDRAKVRDYYGRFVDLWKDADPELQPIVRDVRARVARVGGVH